MISSGAFCILKKKQEKVLTVSDYRVKCKL